jgi:hypothetical protein
MYAKHADNVGLNDLPGHVIGCAFTVLNALGAGAWKKPMKTRSRCKFVRLVYRLCNNPARECTAGTR